MILISDLQGVIISRKSGHNVRTLEPSMLLKPLKLLSSFFIIIFLLTVIVVTYEGDYLPEPLEDIVYAIQETIEDTSDAIDDIVD